MATEKENPFDVLAKVLEGSKSHDEMEKKVWTALKTGVIPEKMNVYLLVAASTMPALAATNMQLGQILKENGLIKEEPAEAPAPAVRKPDFRILEAPNGEKVS